MDEAARTPTTHIFKLPLGLIGGRQADFTTSVDNEWLCLRIFKAFGLLTAQAEIATFGQQRVLVVERFDRVVASNGSHLLRLMQEDFCQATGKSPLIKYENEGGPGLMEMFILLQQSLDTQRDMRTLMASQILFWMLRGTAGVGDEVWSFTAPWHTTWGRKEVRAGYVIVRDGVPAAHMLTMWKEIEDDHLRAQGSDAPAVVKSQMGRID